MEMENQKKISQLQEALTALYLRLNGYFTTSFIIHSDTKGKICSEIDRIGVRFPLHQQPEREVEFSSFLHIPKDRIDLLVVEVKNSKLKFNEPLVLHEKEAISNWKKILRWIGLFTEYEMEFLAQRLTLLVQKTQKYDFEQFRKIEIKSKFGDVQIRPILVAFDKKEPRKGQLRYIYGDVILDYIWYCFNPSIPRKTCATQYDFGAWGEYEPIVRFIKNRHQNNLDKPTLTDFYEALFSNDEIAKNGPLLMDSESFVKIN